MGKQMTLGQKLVLQSIFCLPKVKGLYVRVADIAKDAKLNFNDVCIYLECLLEQGYVEYLDLGTESKAFITSAGVEALPLAIRRSPKQRNTNNYNFKSLKNCTNLKRSIYVYSEGQEPQVVRQEGDDPVCEDDDVNMVFDFMGICYEFFLSNFNCDSYDGEGGTIMACLNNPTTNRPNWEVWGTQEWMVFGKGDGQIISGWTSELDLVSLPFVLGLIQHTIDLRISGETGALRQSLATVFACLVKQSLRRERASRSNWLFGENIIYKANEGSLKIDESSALCSLSDPGYARDNQIYPDMQISHYTNLKTSKGKPDRELNHVNAGIGNRAFFLTSVCLGGYAWDKAGHIWYQGMKQLKPDSGFLEFATLTIEAAKFIGSNEAAAVEYAWRNTGVIDL